MLQWPKVSSASFSEEIHPLWDNIHFDYEPTHKHSFSFCKKLFINDYITPQINLIILRKKTKG